ncbi:voltage gated chloride channel [Gemella morbillorum M424]|uniref:Chloride channel protein n=1 Tax=Gemella morbillorum TaxID=29391 RepID=A0AAP9HBX8_9BACL|nr:chloride channel protein [Gemella morbillorum]EFV35519.1 voltage gated chloride channel [Gemella morbillorum M424]QGS08783.1 chloride channel protein [Gemella morbillorum]
MVNNFYIRSVIVVLLASICCSYFGQVLLFIISKIKDYWNYLIYFTPLILLFTKYSNKYVKTTSISMKYFIEEAIKDKKKISWYFPILLTLNTLLAHGFGASVGREGVAVQLGGAIGKNLGSVEFSKKQCIFLIRLGMISGFAALFQTPLAALFFVLEITFKKVKINLNTVIEFIIYLIASFFSAKASNFLGLEKFFVLVKVEKIDYVLIIKTLLVGICFIFVGVVFVLCQKFFKKIVCNNEKWRWILLTIFILISVLASFRYSSLGTNLIELSLENGLVPSYDFIFKLILTALCTAIGFSGGEVTPLFAIGASLGVVLAGYIGLPIIFTAALGYCLVFSSATKTFVTPIFLALEVFGSTTAILTILPAALIYFLNKKYSIYK